MSIAPDIKTKGFLLTDKGDPSVGIWESQWTVKGDFVFQDKDDLIDFQKLLVNAWEYVTDGRVQIMTLEEASV